ncbi:hypothetical protein M1M25_gp013 [Tenacibaculum phage Gundel_1]|uniref:Uncharacterized protein n=1 Tax=Tenacibaculum phage Gundel_1 TaxID=2745672 RepID=A0A8E4ZK47_9CAUD|nr:hypothetical protein M1M25_gp013 [Tenacibaculum phage Gundel_1]QQV91443.1 hypothetical protein Gundel1_13 [Tenacibaculum phage Gundel_1]
MKKEQKNNCKAVQVNHPLDPIEWNCDCKEAENGEPCSFSWIQTDGSINTLQYGRKMSFFSWEYSEIGGQYTDEKEAEKNKHNWSSKIIDLHDYSKEKVENIISSWGYSIINYDLENRKIKIKQEAEIFNINDSIQLICECISEYEHY